MNNLTLLESILIIYLLVSYCLGIIMLITVYFTPKKVSDILFIIWFGVALPITLPIVLYLLTFDKWKRRKKKRGIDMRNKKSTDITECIRRLKMFYGLPPYDIPTNFVRNDSWFEVSIYNDFEEETIFQAKAKISK